MLDLEQTPALPAEAVVVTDTAGDDMFAKLDRELQRAAIEKLKAYFAKTPTPVVRQTVTTSGLVLLHLAKCWNKPEEHDGGDPCVCVRPDGGYFFRCLHKNCKGLTWKDVEQVYGPLHANGQAKTDKLRIPLITCAELDANRYELEYLIPGVLVARQPCLVGGPKKGMKTSIVIDLVISLATGRPFLGRFAVARPITVIILSGESGLGTLQETARRVALSMDVQLSGIANLLWSDFLPQLEDARHLDALERMIAETKCEVLVVDPLYLCMSGADAANLFIQGSLLRRVSEICQRHGVALVLCHHTRKRSKLKNQGECDPPELDDLAWAGFAEFARQWLLLGRREAYEPGTGEHKLWLSVGGSAGHGGLWAVDIDEGVSGKPRHWSVDLSSPAEAREEKKGDTVRQRLLDAAREFPAGETKSTILETAGKRSDPRVRSIFDALVNEGLLVSCKVKKGSASYDGFRLSTEADNTATANTVA